MTSRSEGRRVLVTGVTGFIGSHLARRHLDDGREVHALVRPGARLDRIPDLVDRVVLHEDGGGPLDDIVATASPDTTYHLATSFVVQHAPDQVGELVSTNVGFPSRLLDALVSTEHPRLVNVGTVWQVAGGRTPGPRNLYAATKQAFEAILAYYVDRTALEAVTVLLPDTYGPRDHRGKVVDALVRALDADEPLLMSSGQQELELLHVHDVVDGLLAAADSIGPQHQHFALGASEALTLREVVARLGTAAGAEVPVTWGARPDRPDDGVAPAQRFPPPPGWRPQVELSAGLAELVEGRPGRAG